MPYNNCFSFLVHQCEKYMEYNDIYSNTNTKQKILQLRNSER